MDLNSVILIGRLTRDAELKFTNAGKGVASFSLAVNGYKKMKCILLIAKNGMPRSLQAF